MSTWTSSQVKSSQVKSSQVKSSQVKSKNIILNLITLAMFTTSLLAQAAVSLSVRHDFTGLVTPSDASGAIGSNGSLTQGRDGFLYGTTQSNFRGAITANGTIFKVSPDGTTFTHLHTFNAVTEGRVPLSGMITGSDGNFYGTTSLGGANNLGTIYKMTTDGTESGTTITILHVFKGGLTDGFGITTAPVQGRDGNLYGTTQGGGQFGWGTVYKLNPSAPAPAYGFTIIHHFNGSEGAVSYAPLIVGKNGNLYGTTSGGGKFGVGTVFSINPAASAPAYGFKTYSFPGLGGLKAPRAAPLMQGSDGFFYGTTGINTGLHGYGMIFKFSAAGAGTFTPLHDFGATNKFSEGANPTAGLVQGSDGRFYGTTPSGGATWSNIGSGCGVLFSLTSALDFRIDYTLSGATEGCQTLQNLTLHTNGKIYGVASRGRDSIPFSGASNIYELNLGTRPFINPTVNTTKAGVKIGIFGDFVGITSIKFNGISISFDKISDTYIEVIVPFGAATGTIVAFKGTIQIKTLKVFLVQPVFTSFSPASGAVGSPVILTGKSLSQVTSIRFGNIVVPLTQISVDNDSQLTVNVPIGAVTGKITIVTKGGSAVSATNFIVTP